MTFIDGINLTLWVGANILVGYIALALVVFAIAYPILFDPRATTAGRFILRFIGSLVGVMSLVFIGVFIDPRADTTWASIPEDIAWWRAGLRFIGYLYVAYSITALVGLLWIRKFRPHTIQTAPNEQTLNVKVRHDGTKK